MTAISRISNRSGSLLSSANRVESPFVRVKIGEYAFGVYEGRSSVRNRQGVTSTTNSSFPNYIKSLSVKKINGTVNQYTLSIDYPVTENDDPNFFEKVFSSVSNTRKIEFTYGDFLLPDYIYKNEEGIITEVKTKLDMKTSVISYTVKAVSTSTLSLSGTYTFPAVTAKPSDLIKKYVVSSGYKLTDVFTGMKNMSLTDLSSLIASDDKKVHIDTCTNMSILEYISYLVACMVPESSTSNSMLKSNVYSFATYEDTTGSSGPYFKIQKVQKSSNMLNQLCTYDIDIGCPSSNIVTQFDIKNAENWSIYYNYNQSLENSNYRKRIDSNGEESYILSPQLPNTNWYVTATDANWWTNVTQYPLTATIKLKGLLKPVVLMQYVKLNIWMWGHKYLASGYYLIKSQTDEVSGNGYFTTLEIVRIAADEDLM